MKRLFHRYCCWVEGLFAYEYSAAIATLALLLSPLWFPPLVFAVSFTTLFGWLDKKLYERWERAQPEPTNFN